MAGTKINEATLRETLKGTENIPIVDTDLPRGRTTLDALKGFIGDARYLDVTNMLPTSDKEPKYGTLSDEDFQKVVDAYEGNVHLAYEDTFGCHPMNIFYDRRIGYFISFILHSEMDNVVMYTMPISIQVRDNDKVFYACANSFTIDKSGDGTKYLSDDGTYRSPEPKALDISGLSNASGTVPDELYAAVEDAYASKLTVCSNGSAFMGMLISKVSDSYYIQVSDVLAGSPGAEDDIQLSYITYVVSSGKTYTRDIRSFKIEQSGEGNKFLSNDGTYKGLGSGTYGNYLDMSEIFPSEGDAPETISDELYQRVMAAYGNKVTSFFIGDAGCMPGYIMGVGGNFVIFFFIVQGTSILNYTVEIGSDKAYAINDYEIALVTSGDGTKFLSDDGTYKPVVEDVLEIDFQIVNLDDQSTQEEIISTFGDYEFMKKVVDYAKGNKRIVVAEKSDLAPDEVNTAYVSSVSFTPMTEKDYLQIRFLYGGDIYSVGIEYFKQDYQEHQQGTLSVSTVKSKLTFE